MKTIILFAQIAVSTILIIVILLQARGSGVSTVFGGEGAFYRSRRGIEKMFVYLTIILAGLFLILSITSVIV